MGGRGAAQKERLAKKREEFVNLYRQSWGSNAGLSSDRLMSMSEKELDTDIRSQRMFLEITSGRRTANEARGMHVKLVIR